MSGVSAKQSLPTYLKIAILMVAASFLVYSIYWAIYGVIWANTFTQILVRINSGQGGALYSLLGSAHLVLLFVQEYASVVGCFILLISAAFGVYAAVLYLRKDSKYKSKLRVVLIFTAVFFILLIPSSIHHLVGTALNWNFVSIYVGLSYILQAMLIVPTLLIMSQKMRAPNNTASTLKWATISAPLLVFALWFKYLFLWIDTLAPMNTQTANPLSTVGTINALFTLLIAGAIITAGCVTLNKNGSKGKKLLSTGIILVGGFFIIFSIVALFVSVYASFWYLTDFWMIILPILGIALLAYFKSK